MGRLSTWPVPFSMLGTAVATEYALKWVSGKAQKEGIDYDILKQCLQDYAGVEVSLRTSDFEGVNYENWLLVREDYHTYGKAEDNFSEQTQNLTDHKNLPLSEANLRNAVSVTGSGDVVLSEDIGTLTAQLSIERSLKLDLNGHMLTIELSEAVGRTSNGIKISPNTTLTILDSAGGGILNISNMAGNSVTLGNGAAINSSDGVLVIQNGEINVTGGYYSAGIGGGNSGSGGTVIISGGIVNAVSSYAGAGIGGGSFSESGKITISGGKVNAISSGSELTGSGGAGIGKGLSGADVIVNIIGRYNYWVSESNQDPVNKTGTGKFTYSNKYKFIKLSELK